MINILAGIILAVGAVMVCGMFCGMYADAKDNRQDVPKVTKEERRQLQAEYLVMVEHEKTKHLSSVGYDWKHYTFITFLFSPFVIFITAVLIWG